MLNLKRIALFCITVSLICSTAFAALFEKKEGAGVMVGEVACYGEHDLQGVILNDFRDTLFANLNGHKKVRLVGSTDWMQDTGDKEEKVLLKNIHMDAIAYAPLFQKEFANAEMIRYAEKVFGRDYFWNEAKLEARKERAKKPYKISPEMTEAAKSIGQKYNADYLFFCNLTETDVELAHSIFNAKAKSFDERPKHIKVETSSFLIDTKNGMVYECHILTEKMGRIQNLFGEYGKGMSTEALLTAMFDMQSEKIIKDVFGNGMETLSD